MRLLSGLFTICALFSVRSLSAQAPQSRLMGRWELHLWVTGPASASAGPSSALGRIELGRLDVDSTSPAYSNGYSVTYDSTLMVMFGPPQLGPAQAVQKGPAGVELAFNPFIDHGAFRLSGRLRGDSIVGEWHRTNFADDGYRGSFAMVRR
jgi:hypothetical protein